MNDFNRVVNDYRNIEVPEELESFMRSVIRRKDRQMRRNKVLKTSVAAAIALGALFIGTVNLSPTAVSAMSEIPVISNLVRVVTFGELKYTDGTREAEIKVPAVEGLKDDALENALNQKYLDESTRLYQEFVHGIGQNELSPQAIVLQTNYKIKTQTEYLLVVERIKLEVGASGAETVTYDNLDLKNQLVITLPGLFKDDSYVDLISEYISAQMKVLTNKEEGILYWFEDAEFIEGFKRIDPEQTFYIDADSKLHIVFDECKVAPCAMGIVEFAVPTETIKDLLVSDTYIH